LQGDRSQTPTIAANIPIGHDISINKLLVSNDPLLHKIFPYSFKQFPQCLFNQGNFDIGIIVGSGGRGDARDIEPFRQEEVMIELFGKKLSASRSVSNVPITDMISASELAAFLGSQYSKTCHKSIIQFPDEIKIICFQDITVPEQVLKRNLILIGGADVNIYTLLATLAFQGKFGVLLPIRFWGDKDGGYFTSDKILSELGQKSYSGKEDSGYMHAGYVLMTANPWNSEKVMIIAVGFRTTGTAAALLALRCNQDTIATDCEKQYQEYERWHCLSENNRFYPNIPGKVVLANTAQTIEGQDIFYPSKEERNFVTRRLPRRFLVTDFEFLE
jgi:hypothetical protein